MWRGGCSSTTTSSRRRLCSFDLETGGEECGIIQLSGEIIHPEITRDREKVANNMLSKITREGTIYNPGTNPDGAVFNAYVNPGQDAVWSPDVTEVTGLSCTDKRITLAKRIDEVWTSFRVFIARNISEDEVGVFHTKISWQATKFSKSLVKESTYVGDWLVLFALINIKWVT